MKDRYERKHRRTMRHPEAIALMANADFDRVPPLVEAMGLTTGETTMPLDFDQLANDVLAILRSAKAEPAAYAMAAQERGIDGERLLAAAIAGRVLEAHMDVTFLPAMAAAIAKATKP